MFTPTQLQRTLEACLRDLSSQKPAVRASAARDLSVAGHDDLDRAATALRAALDDAEPPVRDAVLHAIGSLGLSALLEPVVARTNDLDATVRQQAVIALGEMGSDEAVAALERLASSDRADVQFQALIALAGVAPERAFERALDAVTSDDVWIASEAALQIASFLSPPLRRVRHHGDEGPPVAVSPGDRERAIAALVTALGGTLPRVRTCAALALARVGDDRGRDVLVAFVSREMHVEGEDANELRLDAIEQLGALGGERAADVLRAIAWRVLPSLERAIARAALARLGDERTLAHIASQLRSPWARQREAAVRLAGAGRMLGAVPDLEAILRARRADPFAVVDALRSIGTESARDVLDALSRSDAAEAELRDAALEAIIDMREHRA